MPIIKVMGSCTINGQIVTEVNVQLFLRILADSKIGNNGDNDFTTQELRSFFTHQAGLPSTSSLVEHTKVGFICVEDAYAYIKNRHPDVLEGIGYDVDDTLSPEVPDSLSITQTLVGENGDTFYLFTPFHPGSLSYMIDENNTIVGTYKDGFSSLYLTDYLTENQERTWRINDIPEIRIPLPPVPEIPLEPMVGVHNSHGPVAQTHAALSFWAVTPFPLSNLVLIINGREVEYQSRGTDATDAPKASISSSSVGMSMPLHTFQTGGRFRPGPQRVTLLAEDVLGRTVSMTSIIHVAVWKAGVTEIVTFSTHPTTGEESALAADLTARVEDFNTGHEIDLRRVYFYRGLGDVNVPNPDSMVVHLSYDEEHGISPSFDAAFSHEVEGHMGWPSLSLEDARRLDEIYGELVFLTKSGTREMQIDYAGFKTPISLVPFFSSSPSPTIQAIHGMAGSQNQAYPYEESGIGYFKESLYLFDTPDWDISTQGHPWISSYEMHASVYCIIRSGKKEDLLAALNQNLSGRALELTLEVVEIVERDVKKVEGRLVATAPSGQR
ncbi:MAG: hypothetical protein HY541_05975 [Deltaproteobacteria bacterium]|nr:hypothetical protein [Deltaproteobacteria bacterium]